MTRSSPGVKRMASVIDFMADHPGQAFALTDLVRALKLSRATCHALLTGLVEVGYLYRTSEKTYVLGPALAAIGRVAAEHFSPLQIAKPEMRRLSDDYDVVCSALFLEGDTIVTRERAASVSHVGYSIPLGSRIKLRARSMTPFFAWHPAEAKAFLDAIEPPVPAPVRAHAEGGMAFAREHGFNVHVRNAVYDERDWESENTRSDDSEAAPAQLLLALDAGETYQLSSITAPVFNARGRVEFVLGLMGFNRNVAGTEITVVAGALMAACGRIGDFLAGKVSAD